MTKQKTVTLARLLRMMVLRHIRTATLAPSVRKMCCTSSDKSEESRCNPSHMGGQSQAWAGAWQWAGAWRWVNALQ